MKQWYIELFKHTARNYENECYTKGTEGEVDFIEKEIGYNKDIRILDIGCGTGRHSIALAKRGFKVTGADLSVEMLEVARSKAKATGVEIDFIQADARKLSFKNEFDLIIMLCEGGFPLMETDEMNYRILKNASIALKPKGKFIFTTLNGLFPIFNSIEKFISEASPGNSNQKSSFDLMTFRDNSVFETITDSGEPLVLQCSERYYIPSEITWMLKSLKFKKIDILGSVMGEWNRGRKLSKDDFEMLVIADR